MSSSLCLKEDCIENVYDTEFHMKLLLSFHNTLLGVQAGTKYH